MARQLSCAAQVLDLSKNEVRDQDAEAVSLLAASNQPDSNVRGIETEMCSTHRWSWELGFCHACGGQAIAAMLQFANIKGVKLQGDALTSKGLEVP